MRTFYECGIISAGVLLTRGNELGSMFSEISGRIEIKDFKSKFGASTTWMGKLSYRLDAGRGGGCPILALGIRKSVVSDFEDWKRSHPIIREAELDLIGDQEEIAEDPNDD
jgi:CRISPR-associated protein Csd2